MATTCNFCTTTETFGGSIDDFLSQGSSLTFQMCDGGEPTLVSAQTVGEYVIRRIYSDSDGDAPSQGCYSVCFDTNGVQSIQESPTPQDLDDLRDELLQQLSRLETKLDDVVDLDVEHNIIYNQSERNDLNDFLLGDLVDDELWLNGEVRTFNLSGVSPTTEHTHAKLNISTFVHVGSRKSVNILDVGGRRVFRMDSLNDDDDHSSFSTTTARLNSDGTLTLRMVGRENDHRDVYLQVTHTGYTTINTNI